jgi:uncharacterized protein YkwD/LysM repeat protein
MRYVSASIFLIAFLALGCTLVPAYLATNVQAAQASGTVGTAYDSVTPSPFVSPTATKTSTPTPTSILTLTASPEPTIVADLLDRTNRLRLSLGLPMLIWNQQLSIAAQNQAEWMASSGIVAHQRPDGNLPSQRAFAAGYSNSRWVSEIIYMGGIATVDDAWNFWLTSKVHYTELTRLEHQEVGVGTSSSIAFGQSFVMLFGRFGAVTAIPITAGPGMYIVQPGDTLYLIALRHGTTVEALAAANHIGPNDIIYVGQTLVIPQTVQTAQLSTTPKATITPLAISLTRTLIRHVVQPGETLLMIARQYNVPLDKLIAANGIANPDRIEVGQVITIP